MIFVADVHGAADSLAEVARAGEPLVVLGDLINFIDYRTLDGIVADVCGREFVAEMVELRTSGRFEEARALWRGFSEGRETELRRDYDDRIEAAYVAVCAGLAGSGATVTYGNVDHPTLLQKHLPADCAFVDYGVVEIEGLRVGIVGGGLTSPLGVPGELGDDLMADRLGGMGEVDILGTHVAPAVDPLQADVISGQHKGSPALAQHLLERQPPYHYFGDIHQPQASEWVIGGTVSRNAGYFRATGRGVRHG